MPKRKKILFISSYPPRECGIATYTKDLITALKNKYSNWLDIEVCALEEKEQSRTYPKEVVQTINAFDNESFLTLAENINNDSAIELVFIQHEFGLFGGEYGDYLLYFLHSVNKPVMVTFHTVLPQPDEGRKSIVKTIEKLTKRLVVMTNQSKKILVEQYGISKENITVIKHGTHSVIWKDKQTAKKKYALEDRLILSTFGLISPNKGIETALDALPKIKARYPDVLYLVLGRTHPCIVKNEGEVYRDFLEQKVKDLGLQENVHFVNRYLDLKELLEYLQLTDVYLFTSMDPHQSVSGTFSYAMSSACPIIATAIPHACEMLNDGRGIIIDFGDADQLSDSTLKLLDNPELRENMGRNAFQYTRATVWENSAIKHGLLFQQLSKNNQAMQFDYPPISLQHLKRLTTKFGVIQFSNISQPDINSGYTLDDNARALIAFCMHFELSNDVRDLIYINRYLEYIEHCQQNNGTFLNYVDSNGSFHKQNGNVNLEDSNGRAIWALGYLYSYQHLLPDLFVNRINQIFIRAIPQIEKLNAPRAMAFTIKGLFHYNSIKKDPQIVFLIDRLANRLMELYNKASEDDWRWFEDYLTYANSTLPEASLYAYLATGKSVYKIVAKTTFEFLLSHLFVNGQIKVISNNGWFHKRRPENLFGEQPIDVAYTIETLDLFHKVFNEDRYYYMMEKAFSWFLGNNHLNQIMYDAASGGCYDGLEKENVNLNQGAESTICYIMARMTMEKADLEKEGIEKTEVYAPIQRIKNIKGRKRYHTDEGRAKRDRNLNN